MSSTSIKIAAVAASAALVVAGAQAAHAQSAGPMGSLKAYGADPASGSLLQPVNATARGSLDTGNSSLGEPTSGSLSGILTGVEGSADFSSPRPGTGSVDTGNSSLGEPTTGSLRVVAAPIAGSLGTGLGITTILGSTGAAGGALGSVPMAVVLPLVAVGGSIAVGVVAAPMVQQALAGTGAIPAGSVMPGAPAPKPVPAPAPGPKTPNGRG